MSAGNLNRNRTLPPTLFTSDLGKSQKLIIKITGRTRHSRSPSSVPGDATGPDCDDMHMQSMYVRDM